jgi:hypothetical protein
MKQNITLLAGLLALVASASAYDLIPTIESEDVSPTSTYDFTGGTIIFNADDAPDELTRDAEAAAAYATAAQGALADTAVQPGTAPVLDATNFTNLPDGFDGAWSSLTGTPTTLSGYGITDAYTQAAADAAFATAAQGALADTAVQPGTAPVLDATNFTNLPQGFDGAWSSLTGTPTTLSGYGIIDAYTQSAANAAFATAAQGALADTALQSVNIVATSSPASINLSAGGDGSVLIQPVNGNAGILTWADKQVLDSALQPTTVSPTFFQNNGFDLGSFQLMALGVPKIDWGLGVIYGPTGLPDPRIEWESRVLGGTWTIDGLLVDYLTVTEGMTIPADSVGRTHIEDDAVGPDQFDQLGDYSVASLSLTSLLRLSDRDTDPADPAIGDAVIWLSSGAAAGDAGDLMVKINSGGTTKTITLVDWSTF